MSTAVSLGFSLGAFAVFAASALAFAVAALGLRAATPGAPLGLRGALAAGARNGVVAALGFASVFLVALALEEAGAEVSDLVPAAVLLLAVGAVALAVRSLVRTQEPESTERAVSAHDAVAFGAVYALAALPNALWLLQGVVERQLESRGAGGVMLGILLFCAGTTAALIVLALLAEAGAAAARRVGGARFVAAIVAAAAGAAAFVFWLPALVDGVTERGGFVGDAAVQVAGWLDRLVASYGLVFALVLLAAAGAALVHEVRRPVRS